MAQPTDLLDRVLAHAERAPASPALRDDAETFTYQALAERARSVAAALADLGVEPGDRVALHLDNSAAFVAVALACLWRGAAFVPLPVESPHPRLEAIVADCRPRVVVTADLADLGAGFGAGGDRPRGSERPGGPVRPEIVSSMALADGAGRAREVPRATDPDRDAFVIYTSGTTGVPKGVRVSERAFSRSATVTARILGLDASVRGLNVSAFHFDGSYGLVFSTLVAGGLVRVPRRQEIVFLRRFFELVLDEGIDFTSCSPSYLRLLLRSRLAPRLSGSGLRRVLLGGEECAPQDVGRLWQLLPDLRVFNRYGPTEATIAVTTYEVTPEDVRSGQVPIGRPHPGTELVIVGPDGPVEGAGVAGELYIGGEQLMSGYWGDEELTARVLRRDVVPGTVLYASGDLVSRDEKGRYLYVGRLDDVVKRSGVRISLGEVARAFQSAPGVRGATAALVDRAGSPAITVFVEADAEVDVTVPDLLEQSRALLLESMLPDEVILVPSLPMTPQGKVDRRRLLAEAGREEWKGDHETPSTAAARGDTSGATSSET